MYANWSQGVGGMLLDPGGIPLDIEVALEKKKVDCH